MLKNDAPEYRRGMRIPDFRPASDAVAAALPALMPPARVTVSQAATRRRINVGGAWRPWDNAVAPYMVEPMDMVGSRRYDSIAFAGPARSSKTEALVINPWVHSVLCQPRLVAIFAMVQGAARELSLQDIDPIIANSPELKARLSPARGHDNTYDKRFLGGGRLTIDWPVLNKLSGRSIPLVLFADYDRMDQDVGGQGSPFLMGRKRTTSAGSRGMTVAEASPGFPIENEGWAPETLHEAPPCAGILRIYNTGTRARWYWTCPECGHEFEAAFARMRWPDAGTPAERGAGAYVECPGNGCVLEARHRAELNARGRWLHEGADGKPVPLGEGVRATETLSYWLQGPAAALAPWSLIVSRYLAGIEEYESTGSDSSLKTAMNLDLGLPYLPRGIGEGAQLTAAAIRAGASDHEWKVAPAGTRFILASVDVQPGRFVVAVHAHLPGMERVLIDRFDVFAPPAHAPAAGDRRIEPGRYAEDWDALLPLAARAWPVAGASHALRPAGIAIDSAGEPGVTPNAYAFHRRARMIHRGVFHLVRGRGGPRPKRIEVAAPETSNRGARHVARDILILWASTDLLKDEVAASLLRREAGARALHVPKLAPPEVAEELAAERRTPKGWEKRPGVRRNEALDLAVYDLALALMLKAEKIDWTRPPAWALAGPENSLAVALAAAPAPETPPAPSPETPRPRPRRPTRRRFDGWG